MIVLTEKLWNDLKEIELVAVDAGQLELFPQKPVLVRGVSPEQAASAAVDVFSQSKSSKYEKAKSVVS